VSKVAFDTLARRLRDRAGFTPEHADETAQAIAESMAEEVATKADIAALRAELAEMKADLTRLVLTVATGQVALSSPRCSPSPASATDARGNRD
jgi:hypothetical protein